MPRCPAKSIPFSEHFDWQYQLCLSTVMIKPGSILPGRRLDVGEQRGTPRHCRITVLAVVQQREGRNLPAANEDSFEPDQ